MVVTDVDALVDRFEDERGKAERIESVGHALIVERLVSGLRVARCCARRIPDELASVEHHLADASETGLDGLHRLRDERRILQRLGLDAFHRELHATDLWLRLLLVGLDRLHLVEVQVERRLC